MAMSPVVMIVRESPVKPRDRSRPGMLELIKQRPGALPSLAILIGAQGLVTVVNTATQQLLVLRLIEMVGRAAATVTGIAFGVAGLTNRVSAIGYTAVPPPIGYRNRPPHPPLFLPIPLAVPRRP